ncbi:hypothetical protein MACH10_10440 [Thalassospira tepidiphila]|nr:hypothetical protein MACH10_10440 [Thalassospira tepidiphila]
MRNICRIVGYNVECHWISYLESGDGLLRVKFAISDKATVTTISKISPCRAKSNLHDR